MGAKPLLIILLIFIRPVNSDGYHPFDATPTDLYQASDGHHHLYAGGSELNQDNDGHHNLTAVGTDLYQASHADLCQDSDNNKANEKPRKPPDENVVGE